MVSHRIRAALLVSTFVTVAGCSDDGYPPFRERCASLPRLPSAAKVQLERAFGGIDIDRAVALVQHPTDDARFYVVVQDGLVHEVQEDGARAEVIDLSGALAIFPESGLLGMAFDPRFADNGYVYLSLDVPGEPAMTSRISRFTSDDDGRTIDPDSESIVLELAQPYTNHNGGHLAFGNDGMLYIGFGDGGSAGDPQGNGQDPDVLLGKLLRIDVSGATPYTIPPDNPFAQGGGAPEVWALGLRNPWRWSFDRQTGALWVGDVGQNRFEEVDLVVKGGNYGWGRKEGFECIGVTTCDDPAFLDPIAAYRNNGGASVVAGAVLRGGALAELDGTFVYSDFYDGAIWGVRDDGEAPVLLGEGAREVSHWLLARDGTMLALGYHGGISRLVPGTPDPAGEAAFPRKLSATGCVDVDDPEAVPEGLVPYEINLPFWSDGAEKQRFVALPEDARGHVDGAGAITWPVGTTLVKTFLRDGVRIETRLLARHESGWRGYGYAWDDDGDDATLVEDERVEERAGLPWIQPGLRGCPACHASGDPLGTTGAQLARTLDDGSDQLDRLVALGVLDRRPDVAPLPTVDAGASLDELARTYLDVNCSQCHREDGTGGRASLDLRRQVPLADTGLCEAPRAGELGLEDARIVVPGDPARSVLSSRLHATADGRMPPLATAIVDEGSAVTIDAWIESLASCP